MNITDFLEARIAEDKEEAEHFLERYKQGEDISKRRWLRILREAEAKQAIASFHQLRSDMLCSTCVETGPDAQAFPCDTLKAVAAVYRDHPDYRQEWAL